jgi:protein tyrosine phosphatase (PTP) superfamily phosphohydrolase (DUF442 family)
MTSPIPAFFRLDGTLSTGGQPSAEALPWIAAQGFASVLNVNTSTARSFLAAEGELLAKAGVRYVHHPIDCAVLTPEKYEGFRDALNALLPHGPVFVHCAGNVKVTGMMHAYRVLERGEPVERASADLARLPALEPKWYAFFERLGVAPADEEDPLARSA